MNIAFHTGKTAMIAQAQALNIYGNNIANINTYGYQTQRPSFADTLYSVERATEPEWQTGHGAFIQKTDLMFEESHFYYSDMPTDFAIAGKGFFAVEDRYGEVNYTRDGSFHITQEGEDWYLASGTGEYVLDYDGNRIVVPFNEEGTAPDYGALYDMVGVYEFENPFGIEAMGNNRYTATDRSGVPAANRNMEKLQGVLVVSNVDLATQMVKLIETQRAYQISSRIVTTADEFTRIANNLR